MQVSSRFRRNTFLLSATLGAAFLSCLTAMLLVAPAALAAPAKPYIVILNDDVAHPANVAHRHEENRGAKLGHIYGTAIEGYSAELAPNEMKAIKQDPNVDYVVPDGTMQADAQVPSIGIKRDFALNNPKLDIDEVDDVRVDADVAVLDSGVAPHPDLNIAGRMNCITLNHPGAGCWSGSGEDVFGHGTHVAGIVGALDNNFGVVGTAPGARIWSVKVLRDDTGETQEEDDKATAVLSDVIAAVNWVTANSNQIEVVNMSLGCEEEAECNAKPLHEAITASVNKGVVYVVSAGNFDHNVDGEGTGASKTFRYAPAWFPEVITVSALEDSDGAPGGIGGAPSCKYSGGYFVDQSVTPNVEYHLEQDDRLAKFSNWGPAVDITAPGTCINSTYPGGGYQVLSGTSMSTPMVAGAVATLAAVNNPSNASDVEGIRNYLRSLGNYNWTDVHQARNTNQSPYEWALVGDGVQEPLLAQGTPPPPPSPPTATIGSATNLTENSTVLTGTVNPQGSDGRYKFECGLLGAGYTIVPDPAGAYFGPGYNPVGVSGTIGGLTPGASYHCRMAAWNVGPLVYTGDVTFTTPKMRSYVAPGAPAPLRVSDGSIHVFTRLFGAGDELNFTRATSGMWTAANLTPAGQPKMGASSAVLQMKNGAMHAFAINTAGDIVCYYRTGTEPWNYLNLSNYAGATMKFDSTTTPSAVESGPDEVGVYARAVNGDLVSLERRANGTWFMWDESEHTNGHPTISGSPAAVVLDNPSAYANTGLIVFARNASNQLVSFNRNTSGEWTPYNVSEKTGVTINASPTAVQLDPNIYAGSGLDVYTTNASNDLLEFSRASSGTWTIYNVTQNITGKPTVTGSVAPIRLSPDLYAGSVLGVYARTTGNDLVGFDRKANGAWYFYNVSATNGFPKISSSPSVLSLNPSQYAGSGLQVHARSTGNELISFDRFMDGGWHYYNETANVPGHQKAE